MSTKQSVRRRFLGGGFVSLAIAGGLFVAFGAPTQLEDLLLLSWLAIGGLALVVAAAVERLPLGVVSVSWPRIGAVGLAVLALGSSTVGFVQLLEVSGWVGLLNAVFALGLH